MLYNITKYNLVFAKTVFCELCHDNVKMGNFNNLMTISQEEPEFPNFNSEKAVAKFFDKKS